MTSLPPKPTHNFFPLRFSLPMPASVAERHAMISLEAYLRSERRGFEPGYEIEDWVAAEAEVDARLAHARKLSGLSGW
jgi:hypothetical protein